MKEDARSMSGLGKRLSISFFAFFTMALVCFWTSACKAAINNLKHKPATWGTWAAL
jgi:hypothetical protein